MKITKDVDYAIRCVLFLTLQKNSFSATKHQIAKEMKIPHQFLAKIAQQLHRQRILDISKGPKGMYRLLKKPEDITLLEIIEAIKGRIFLNYCVANDNQCFRQENCYVNKIWCNLTESIREYLNKINFKEISDKEVCYFSTNIK